MVHFSKTLFQACLLLTLTQCYCQDYETNYDESEDAQDESGPVDYSKYYAVDTSAPLVANQGNPGQVGFTSPIEYASFFDPSIGKYPSSINKLYINPFRFRSVH